MLTVAPARARTDDSRTIRTSATTRCSTNTSTATTATASAPRTRPDGPVSSPNCCESAARLRLPVSLQAPVEQALHDHDIADLRCARGVNECHAAAPCAAGEIVED